jgi:hypothetical protein
MANIDIAQRVAGKALPPVRVVGESTGSAASRGRRKCTGTAPDVQQWSVPNQIRCALGTLASASLSVMQAGEPLASDGPIMEVTARIRITRAVIAEATSTFIEMNTGSLAIFAAIRRASLI